MPSIRSTLLVLITALALLVPAQTAHGQCEEPPFGWQANVGNPWVGAAVLAMAVMPDGSVIVGGSFSAPGGVPANNIARYDPTTGAWSALGSGVGGPVSAVVVLPGGDIVVGGSFSTAGGVPARNIARYNPSDNVWSALGSGTGVGTSTVRALAVLPGGDVILGGTFTEAGGVPANNIARYNPESGAWSALGSGLNSWVYTLSVLPDGDLLVGGSFSSAGGVYTNGAARYSAATGVWSAWAPGYGGWSLGAVYAFAPLPNGDLMIASTRSIGGLSTAYVWRYIRSTGQMLQLVYATGSSFRVNSLVVLPGGDVILGGEIPALLNWGLAHNIVRYNPTTGVWSPFGSGLDFRVNALATLPNGDLIAGGQLSLAGAGGSERFARYNFSMYPVCPPCPGDYNCDGVVSIWDVRMFFADFERGEACADVDQNGGVDGADVACFYQFYEAGGC